MRAHWGKTTSYGQRKCSAHAYRCVYIPPLECQSLECVNSQSLLGDWGALYVSDTAWEGVGDLSFECNKILALLIAYVFLAYVASTRAPDLFLVPKL